MITPRLLHQSAIDETLAAELAELRERDRERTLKCVAGRTGAIVKTDAGSAVDFSSNDYLGLASDSRLAESAARAMREHGVGAAASRLISGNNPEHEALEADLAEFFGAERALTFSSGYAANVGIIPALVGPGDVVFSDALNHASLIDGCRLSRADVHVYPHGDVGALVALLDRHRPAAQRALIVSDGLFSMDGDVAPIADLIDLAARFDAWTYIDDAHAVGVAGRDGRGSVSAAGCDGCIDVTVGTLGKAFGTAGAFVYGSSTLIQYLINRARSFVFSTAMLPAQAAAAREALRIVGTEPERRERLHANAEWLRASLHESQIPVIGTAIRGLAHIIPVHVGTEKHAMRMGAALARDGYLVGAVRPPTVPEGGSRLRVTVSSAHTLQQMAGLTASLVAARRE